jgi:hypothetical protein
MVECDTDGRGAIGKSYRKRTVLQPTDTESMKLRSKVERRETPRINPGELFDK